MWRSELMAGAENPYGGQVFDMSRRTEVEVVRVAPQITEGLRGVIKALAFTPRRVLSAAT